MVPKVIHQIWFQGRRQIPEKYEKDLKKLKSLNPDWQHIVWDDRMLRALCMRVDPRYLVCYDSYRYMHQKIDFGRCVALYVYGGISVDMDVEALRPFSAMGDLMESNKLIVSENSLQLYWPEKKVLGMKKYLNNSTFACDKRHPAMKRLIESMVGAKHAFHTGNKFLDIQRTTGPILVSTALGDSPDVLVLPYWYFEPCSIAKGCKVHPQAILNHKHDATWVSMSPNVLQALYWVWEYRIIAYVLILGLLLRWLVAAVF